MSKLKENIGKIYLTFKKSINKFPLTIVTIIILTLIYVINFEENFIKENMLKNIICFGLVLANGTFLTETISKQKINTIVGYIISAILATVFTYIYSEPDVLSTTIMNWLENLFICSMISVFVLSIYFNYKQSAKPFEQYITSVFINVFKTSIIYLILAIGSGIVTFIFIYLILNDSGYELLIRIELLIFGIYYIPTLLYSLYNIGEETSKFSKIVIKYILETLVIVAFIIIYIYIIKIIVLRNIPSNEIFRVLAALFVLGLPIWTMVETFNENTVIDKINKLLPVLFIPFIILQIYSIGVRILDNGITENRYLCIILILFEIIYTIIKLTKKENIGEILLVFIVLTIISTIVPYINMYKVSQISQFNNIKIFKEKNEYTEDEKQKIYGAYRYLQTTDEGNKLIEGLLTKNEEKEIENLSKNNDEWQHINARININHIDVAKYKNLYTISLFNYSNNQGNIKEIFENLKLNIKDNNEIIYINIYPKINQYIRYGNKLRSNFKNINKIQIDDSRILILENIDILYNKTNYKVKHYDLSGYLLE